MTVDDGYKRDLKKEKKITSEFRIPLYGCLLILF